MDLVTPLGQGQVTGRFDDSIESVLCARPELVMLAARALVGSNFPDTVAPDVLTAVGLDPGAVLDAADMLPGAPVADELFDLGALGLDLDMRVLVSTTFSARTAAGRAVYDRHGMTLRPRRGTLLPSAAHVAWHAREVFKGQPLAA